MILYWSNTREGRNITDDAVIESDCNEVSFINQGITDCRIYWADSQGYRLLGPGDSVDYSNDPNIKEVTKIRVVFTGGTGDLYIEKSFKKLLPCQGDKK